MVSNEMRGGRLMVDALLVSNKFYLLSVFSPKSFISPLLMTLIYII